MEKSAENRFTGLDLIKVIAISWICLYHLLDFYNNWQLGTMYGGGQYWDYFFKDGGYFSALIKTFIGLGVIGVNLFIIASGLGLAISANKRKVDYRAFIAKRLWRILPAYWIALFALFLIQIYHGQVVDYFDYLVHFLGISNFFPQYVLSISAPLWFIGTILQLYLLFPPLLRLAKKSPALLILLAVVCQVFVGPKLMEFFGGGRFFTEYIVDFSVGIIIGNALIKNPRLFARGKWLLLFVPLIISLWIILFKNVYSYHFAGALVYQILAASLFVLLFLLGGKMEKFSKSLALLSSLSFIVFLTHYVLITELLPRVNLQLPFWAQLIIFLPVFFVCAFLAQRLFTLGFRPQRTP